MKKFKKDFCPVPFTTLILNPNGKVGTCRELGNKHIVGDITKNTIDEIWNGEEIQKLRKEFLDGEIETCKSHIGAKNCHQLNENLKLINERFDPKVVMDSPIVRLSPDFNGKCNLKCSMCDVWQLPNMLYDEINFWPILKEKILPNLKEFDLLGGEPFIQKDLYRLIDLAAKINPDIIWKFTTNANWILNKSITRYLDKIKIKHISISLDTVNPETYLKLRTGILNKTLLNIKKLQEYQSRRTLEGRTFDIFINFTIQKDNWIEMKEIMNFCDENNLQYLPFYLISPVELSILDFPTDYKLKIINRYFSELDNRQLRFAHRVIRALINSLESNIKKESLLKFYSKLTNTN